ncbi:MAG: DUF4835 family protein [Fidelibacterota bacterium]
MKFCYYSLIISAFFVTSAVQAQFGTISVTVDHHLLKDNDRQELVTISENIERFYSGQVWDEDYQDLAIPLHIQFVFEGTAQKGGQKTYHAQALFSDGMDLRYFDQSVQFYFNPGSSLYYDPAVFDPLASFLAFYTYLILGGQEDTYELHGGNYAYEQARVIALRAVSSDYPKGWAQRLITLNEIIANKGLREARFAFYLAQDLFQQGHVDEALTEFNNMMKGLELVFRDYPRGRALYFLKAHTEDLANYLKTLGQTEMLTKLVEMNPENKEVYQRAIAALED